MKFWKYIVRNSLRNKLRTTLTILSTAFSLLLVTVLYGYLALQEDFKGLSRQHNRLVVMNEQGLVAALPLAYLERIRNLPGVKVAVPLSWYGGVYQDERIPFAQFGTDANQVFVQFPQQVKDNLRTNGYGAFAGDRPVVRLVTSFNTSAEEINAFVAAARGPGNTRQ